MQLPSVDRQSGLRLSGADLVSSSGQKVIPVPPVNPAVASASPGVVNRISDSAAQASASASRVYTSVSDPAQRGSEAATSPKDWTIQRPKPEKVQFPPPEPISKMLLEFVQSMWRASGSAVEIAQAQNQNAQLNRNNPIAAAGALAKENLTYSPSKIKKNESL
jgi:hypothetical protein